MKKKEKKAKQEIAKSSADRMRSASGSVNSSHTLDAFLYLLMRDHVTPGEVEDIMNQITVDVSEFSNGWLAENAIDVRKRLV